MAGGLYADRAGRHEPALGRELEVRLSPAAILRRAQAGASVLLAGAALHPAQARDDLTIGVSQFPSSMHPAVNPEVIKSYVLGFADRPIDGFDQSWKLACMLCTEIPTVQNGGARLEDVPGGGKGMAVTLHFRPGLFWGDGVPVTAADLAFTARVGRNPNSGFADTHLWEKVRSVEVVDDSTAVLHLNEVAYDYNQWGDLLPAHLEAPVFDAATAPGDYINQSVFNRAPTTPGLYDGPFLITDYRAGEQIVLQPNPHWTGTKPGFAHIVIRTIGNTAALEANLLSGDIDMTAGEGIGLGLDQALSLRARQPDRFDYIFKPSLTYQHIDVQLGNPILADARVRRALLLGLDRQAMVDKLFQGVAPVAATWVNPLEAAFDPAIKPVPYDPAQARALLAQAGWTPGPDGICRNASGDRLSIDFATTSGNTARELQQQVMQSQWRAIGVDVHIANQPPRTLFGETLKHRAFTGLVMFGWSSAPGNIPRQILHSSQIPTAANNWGGTDYTGFKDQAMDHDIEAAEQELDPDREKQFLFDMQRIYAEQLPVLPLYFGADAHVIPHWLAGYAPTGNNDPSSEWAENWHPR
jgi:peptide/nickel transport system substrate-binding protein